MWRLAILAACIVVALSEDGLRLQVKPCSSAAINSGSNNKVAISWDHTAGECNYKITDVSGDEVESGTATGQVSAAPMDVGRYRVDVTCSKGSESMYFNAIFVQSPSEGKLISATAIPSSTSAYVSFSSTERSVSFTCQLDGQEEAEDCASPWHSTQHLGSGMHYLTVRLSTLGGGDLQARETLRIPFRL